MEAGRELEGVVLADRYLLQSCLDEGNFGWVYRAEHQLFGQAVRTVAVKVTKMTGIGAQEAREVFEEPITLARIIDGTEEESFRRYLVQIYDLGVLPEHDGRGFIVMEFISGGNLDRLLRDTQMPQWDVLEYALEICRGMSAVHDQGVIHRDLKPDNLLLTPARQIKIADFGLSARMIASRGYVPGVAGTTLWMAPETMDRSNPRSDPRSDVYSIGLVLYRMLTGTHPFSELIPPRELSPDEEAQWLLKHRMSLAVRRPSQINATVDDRMDKVVMTAMDPRPNVRFPNAGAMLRELEKIVVVCGDPREKLLARAREAAGCRRWEKAARHFTECIDEEPNAADEIAFEAHRGLGRCLGELGRWQEAIEALKRAETINERRNVLKDTRDIREFFDEIAEAFRSAGNPLAACGYDVKARRLRRR
ncbi:MAG: protein kinase domain-containing protein [Armatimonadota bacterium]